VDSDLKIGIDNAVSLSSVSPGDLALLWSTAAVDPDLNIVPPCGVSPLHHRVTWHSSGVQQQLIQILTLPKFEFDNTVPPCSVSPLDHLVTWHSCGVLQQWIRILTLSLLLPGTTSKYGTSEL
jgi:hypothetical protein